MDTLRRSMTGTARSDSAINPGERPIPNQSAQGTAPSSSSSDSIELTRIEASRVTCNSTKAASGSRNDHDYDGNDHHHRQELEPILRNDDDADNKNDLTIHNKDLHGLSSSSSSPGSSNNLQVATNIVVSFVGAGLLGVPNAFLQAGWLLGSVTLCIVSALNVYAMLLLPQVQRAIMAKQQQQQQADALQRPCQSYGDLGRCILGPKGETLVNVALGISQAGFATAYIIFIAANLKATWQLPRGPVCLACIPGLAALVQFREVKSLSPFSFMANVCNFLALSAVLVQDYESYVPHNSVIRPVKWSGFLYVIAITIYSMEGVGLILSLEASAKHRSGFVGLFKLMLTCITLFMAFFGSAGYWAFGDDTKAPITLNLGGGNGDWAASFVKIALCLGLYLTYPIMMFPIWSIMERIYPSTAKNPRARILFRGSLICVSALIAYCIPNFGMFLSLVGSSICNLLGFILPCYFHLAVMGNELVPWQRFLDNFLIVGGAIFGVLGTFHSVRAMIAGELEGDR